MTSSFLFVLSYIIALLLIIYLKKDEKTLMLYLGLLFGVVIYLTKYNMIIALVIAFLFCIVEYICVEHGVWKYNYVENNIPVWLIFAWSMSVVFIMKVYEYLLKKV